jgi:hypothetical protein
VLSTHIALEKQDMCACNFSWENDEGRIPERQKRGKIISNVNLQKDNVRIL